MSTRLSLVRNGLIAAGLAALSAASAGAATPTAASDHPRSCFFISDWRGWKAPRPDVLLLDVRPHDVYRVQLSAESPFLQSPGVRLISEVRGRVYICDPLDLDLSVSDGHGPGEGLIVRSITKLTPDEVAAIPAKFRP